MSTLNPSSLQIFLHYYSVERTVSEDSGSDLDLNTLWSHAMKHLSRDTIEQLIAFAGYALETFDDARIQDAFKNGNMYFVWRTPDSARRYLQEILNFAKHTLESQE